MDIGEIGVAISRNLLWSRGRVLVWAVGAVSILLVSLVASRADAEAPTSLAELLQGKSAQLRVCNDAAANTAMCEEIALALTQNDADLAAVGLTVAIPDIKDNRMGALGRDCPASGADAKGDPYLPFELEYDGWQAIPNGPFEVFDIATVYPKWRAHHIVSAAGYNYEEQRLSTGQPLSWKSYYMMPIHSACPPFLVDALFHRGREAASTQKVDDALVVWQGRVLVVSAQEEPTASNRYYVSVSLVPDDPLTIEQRGSAGRAGRTHLVSFIAQ